LWTQFASELEVLGGTTAQVTEAEAAEWLAGWLKARGTVEVLSWAEAALPVRGLWPALRANGIGVLGGEVPRDEPGRSETLARWEQVRVGITGAEAALADHGTLALRSGRGRPRLASLSVETHVALVRPAQLYASWAAWLRAGVGAAWAAEASNVTLITGPSRTADIEMTLTVGVHGPGAVMAVLVT
jgi:L-lactate dehydrogenase complex protein LldG